MDKHRVDRAMCLAEMEDPDMLEHFLLRPHRFDKSPAVSVMKYYYDEQRRAKF